MKKLLTILIGLLVVSALLLAACQPAASEPAVVEPEPVVEEPVQEPAAGVKQGGTLYWQEFAIVTLDLPFIVDGPSFDVASNIYSFLFRVTGDGTVIPDLAETWEYENDNKSVVFHLRKGVTFHDGNDVFAEGEGREVTAADVVYTMERYMTIEGGQQTSDLALLYESIEALDDYTVRLNLKNPDALLFVIGRGLTSLGIVPKEGVEFYGDTWGINPIGSGPFKLKQYVPDDSITLVANKNHYIVPNIDEVVFKIIPDESTAALALEAGEIDHLATTNTATFDQYVGNDNFVTVTGSCPWNYYIHYDMDDPIISNFEVRKAIGHVIDGESIIKAVVGGMYIGGCGTAGPDVPGYDPELCNKYFSYDTELAAQTLTEAGWAKNASGVYEKDGTPISIQLEIWNEPAVADMASAVITQLKAFGIQAELLQVEFGTWIDDFYGGNEKDMMFSYGFCGDGGLNALWGTSGLAYTLGYVNEEASALIDSANYIVDPVERDNVLREAQDLIYRDYPVHTLGFASGGAIINKRVQDYEGTFWFLNLVTTANNVWLAE